MKKMLLSLSFIVLLAATLCAQVAVTTDGSPAGANTMLDIKSNNKGVKFPGLTTAQRKAIPVSVADAGLMLFDTDKQALYMYDGAQWLFFSASANSLSLLKNKIPVTSPNANFGQVCDINGDYAVVGAYNDTVGNHSGAGSAYVYKRINGNWVQQKRLLAGDPAAEDNFGYEVAIEGDYLAVGAVKASNYSNARSGAVYVFKRNGDNWEQQAKLTASDGGTNYSFGQSVAIQGSVIVVSARGTKVGNNINQGAAYVFNRTGETWTQQTRLVAGDGVADSYFGNSVAIDNNDIVVGAGNTTVSGIKCGAAYVFSKINNNWVFQLKLNSSTPAPGGVFGTSVSISNGSIVVGAPGESMAGRKTGLVHLFNKINNAWVYAYADAPMTNDNDILYGADVIVRDNILLVGACYETIGNATKQGSVYAYKKNTGNGFDLFKKITDPNGMAYDVFGTSIGFDGNSFIVGLPNKQRAPGLFGYGMVFFGAME